MPRKVYIPLLSVRAVDRNKAKEEVRKIFKGATFYR